MYINRIEWADGCSDDRLHRGEKLQPAELNLATRMWSPFEVKSSMLIIDTCLSIEATILLGDIETNFEVPPFRSSFSPIEFL
jgi:hypothetical protein